MTTTTRVRTRRAAERSRRRRHCSRLLAPAAQGLRWARFLQLQIGYEPERLADRTGRVEQSTAELRARFEEERDELRRQLEEARGEAERARQRAEGVERELHKARAKAQWFEHLGCAVM